MSLQGIRVVEIGQVLSAPYAGMIFSDLGAEVIKVEKPVTGDDARNMGPAFRHDASMTFHDVNRGKRSVVIDLKSPEGIQQLFSLLANADVLVHNLRPGEAQKLGLGQDVVCEAFPRLIYCELTAFGHKGPRRLQPGYEPLLQAFSGLISMNGNEEGPPARMGASLVDQGTAMWAVIGVLTALRERDQTGKGAVVNASLLETAMAWAAPRIHGYVNEGRESRRYGTAHPGLVPYQGFDTADGPIMICVGNDRLFTKFAQAMGHPDWCDDERFATNRQRLQNRQAMVQTIQSVLHTAGRGEWISRLEAAGVPVAAINSIPEALAEPQVQAIDMLRPVGDEGFMLAGLPLSFDSVRPAVTRPAPRLGEDNDTYLAARS
nr:CoA transferase [Pseudomonas sp.]